MTKDEADALARKWEVWIAEMRQASSMTALDAMLNRARADKHMPRQVLDHIEHSTYAETRSRLRGQAHRSSGKDRAAGEDA
jgi:hypothetical protein